MARTLALLAVAALLAGCGASSGSPSSGGSADTPPTLDREQVDRILAAVRDLDTTTVAAARTASRGRPLRRALTLTACPMEGTGVGKIEAGAGFATAGDTAQLRRAVVGAWEDAGLKPDAGTDDDTVSVAREVDGVRVAAVLRPQDGGMKLDTGTDCLDLGPELYAEVDSELFDAGGLADDL